MTKYTNKDVQIMQNRPYEEQMNVFYSKIVEAFMLSDYKIFVAFSGGKDSTFLLFHVANCWSMMSHNKEPLCVVFNDTTIEYKGMPQFVEWYVSYLEKTFHIKINLYKTRPSGSQTFVSVCREKGIPLISKQVAHGISKIRNYMKKFGVSYEEILLHREKTLENVEYLQKRFGGRKETTLLLLGYTSSKQKFGSESKIANKWIPLLNAPFELTDECCAILKHSNIPQDFNGWTGMTGEMAEESRKRLISYQSTGCNESIIPGGGGKSKPMGPMVLQTVLRNVYENKIPLFKYYGEVVKEEEKYRTSGMFRTGCSLCVFGIEFDPNRFVKLYELEPQRVRFAFRAREKGGLGYKEAFEYCNKYCGTNWGIPIVED